MYRLMKEPSVRTEERFGPADKTSSTASLFRCCSIKAHPSILKGRQTFLESGPLSVTSIGNLKMFISTLFREKILLKVNPGIISTLQSIEFTTFSVFPALYFNFHCSKILNIPFI